MNKFEIRYLHSTAEKKEKRMSFWSKLFPKDLEHILSEIPTDVLIVKMKKDE